MDMKLIREATTVVWFCSFVGICIWAYLPSNKKIFEADAKLPFVAEDKLTEDNHE